MTSKWSKASKLDCPVGHQRRVRLMQSDVHELRLYEFPCRILAYGYSRAEALRVVENRSPKELRPSPGRPRPGDRHQR